MSNKTKGWLMLSPIIAALLGGLIYLMGWWVPVVVLAWYLTTTYVTKAILLITKNE